MAAQRLAGRLILMLIILQHNAAHLGIVTGLCLAESSTKFFGKLASRLFLSSALAAAVSTAMAEVLGAAIGLNILFQIPVRTGAPFTALASGYLLFSNCYRNLEKWIIAIVSVIGFSFLFELSLVKVGWKEAANGWVLPVIPTRSLPLVMSILGAVVMPHNLFLHSEIIQSRKLNLEGDEAKANQLKYEFTNTLLAMLIGWAINSAIIIMAASVFSTRGIAVTDLAQADANLRPLLGGAAGMIFGLALLLSGFSSSVTAAMAGGSIFSGIFSEPFDISDTHSRTGAAITLAGPITAVFLVKDFFQGIIWSQIILSIQLPWSIFSLVSLTSSSRVLGKFSNSFGDNVLLWSTAIIVSGLNIVLFASII